MSPSGEISPGTPFNPAIDSPGTTFANTTTAGLFSEPLLAEEWVDWGVKSGGLTTVACFVEIGYATTALDSSIGGPGASLDVAIYEGTVGGCAVGDVSTEVARLSFTDLPGSLDDSPAGYTINYQLSTDTFQLADGPIGWSYVGVDGVTGPLLITVGADPTSTADGFDLYVPEPAVTGFCLGTFPFTTPGVGSFYFRLEEEDGTAVGTQTPRPGTGFNVGVLTPDVNPPAIGQTWQPSMTTPAVATPILDFLAVSSLSTAPVIVPGFGEIMIGVTAPNPLVVVSGPPGAGTPFSVPFPLNCSFIGVSLTSQAGQLDASSTIGLTDALDFTFGI